MPAANASRVTLAMRVFSLTGSFSNTSKPMPSHSPGPALLPRSGIKSQSGSMATAMISTTSSL